MVLELMCFHVLLLCAFVGGKEEFDEKKRTGSIGGQYKKEPMSRTDSDMLSAWERLI